MENKESWVKETLASMDHMQQATVSPQLQQALIEQATSLRKLKSIRPIAKWAVAASIVLLAGFNVISVIHCSKPTHVQNETNPVYKEYFSYINEF